MIKVREIKIGINEPIELIKKRIAKKLNIKESNILEYKILKESIDARKKQNILFVYEVAVKLTNEKEILNKNKDVTIYEDIKYTPVLTGIKKIKRPVIVGSGPAGIFCAYELAKYGFSPIVIERGENVESRIKSVENFWTTGKLNPESNVQFGEGGAGTFSDGKLNTLVKDSIRQKEVFEIFVSHGADSSILYKNKPHIGTDKLRDIIASMRNEILKNNGEIRYNTKLTNLNIKDNKLVSIEVNNNEMIDTDILVLAIGHSARDTFYMLNNYLKMESKPFALGVRVMHPQSEINKSQYGMEQNDKLGAASYKLVHQASTKKAVYTFCMCPGGYVVNASSEQGRLAINGMSNHDRESINANSAVVVTVDSNDFGPNLFDGLEFQRRLEEKAYELGNGLIPVTLYKDYKENKISTSFGSIKPVFKGNTEFANLNELFPNIINETIKEGIEAFSKKIPIYNHPDTIIAGIESRTSSPVRIIRNEDLVSNIEGIYPCGEGAGYAGGITTAAMDGIKVFESIAKEYYN